MASTPPSPPGSCNDVLSPFSLLSHFNHRAGEDYFDEYAYSALYLFKVLESTTYFDSLNNEFQQGCEGKLLSQEEADGDSVGSNEVVSEAADVEEFKNVVLKILFFYCLIRSANTFTVMEDRLKDDDLWASERIKVGAGSSSSKSILEF